jgi:hypothetical protein
MAGYPVRASGSFTWSLVAAALLSIPGAIQAQPYLFDRGNGMVYNSWQDRTWLKDSKYIKTLGLDSDGLVTSAVARAFAENLVVAGFDDWRLPYDATYSGGDMYMLYGTFNSEWAAPSNKGPFLNIDWNTKYWVQGGGRYEGQWFAYDFGSGPIPSGVHPAYANELFGAWPSRAGDVLGYVNANIDHQMDNGNFSSADFTGWNVTGIGTVDIAAYPGTGNFLAKMTTSSPVDLWQLTDTPASAFCLMFDFDFAQADGLISVYLNGVHLDDVSGQHGQLVPWQYVVNDPALQGLTGAKLCFQMNGPRSGLVGYVDNISFSAVTVPEPATFGLLALGGLALARRRR